MSAGPKNYIIGIIIFVIIIVGGVSWLSFFQAKDSTYSGNEVSEFNKTFNKMNDITTQVQGLQNSVTNADTDFGVFGVLNALISSAWQSLRLLFTSLGFMTGVYSGMTAFFGVPAWIPLLVGLIISTVLIFAIFSAIFQREL